MCLHADEFRRFLGTSQRWAHLPHQECAGAAHRKGVMRNRADDVPAYKTARGPRACGPWPPQQPSNSQGG